MASSCTRASCGLAGSGWGWWGFCERSWAGALSSSSLASCFGHRRARVLAQGLLFERRVRDRPMIVSLRLLLPRLVLQITTIRHPNLSVCKYFQAVAVLGSIHRLKPQSSLSNLLHASSACGAHEWMGQTTVSMATVWLSTTVRLETFWLVGSWWLQAVGGEV